MITLLKKLRFCSVWACDAPSHWDAHLSLIDTLE